MATGKNIAARAGCRLMVLELGSNDPLIVMEGAHLDEAAAPPSEGPRIVASRLALPPQ